MTTFFFIRKVQKKIITNQHKHETDKLNFHSDFHSMEKKSVVSFLLYTVRIKVLTLETNNLKNVYFYFYMNYDCRTLESLHEYQSWVSFISNIISEETFDESIVIGDMNCDPDKVKFFHELMSHTTLHSPPWADIQQLP